MKKVKKFIYENWFFIILIIPFILICFSNKLPDNDIWFLLNNGRYVVGNGIPHIDPFTIHEGLKYIMQQWASSILLWGIYDMFGPKGLIVFIYVMAILLMAIFYKLCYVISDKKNLSILATCVTFSLISKFIVLRPQIISYLLLLLEILCLELYVKKKKNLYLMFLPLISFLLINFHASMWYFQFVFLLPFICNGLCIEKIPYFGKFKIDNYKLKPILISFIFVILVGFINPYGLEAITFIFKSYGITVLNTNILEMMPNSFDKTFGKITLAITLMIGLLCYFKKDLKFDIRHICFICGGIILGNMHIKCYPWFVLLVIFSLVYAFKDFIISVKFFNKFKNILKALYNGLIISSCFFGILTLFYTLYYSYNSFKLESGILGWNYEDITDYVVDHYDKEKVILYVGFDNGGYAEFKGLRPYIDGRAELFVKKFNGKSDIFQESVLVWDGALDMEKFINKYNFTHLIVMHDTPIDTYLMGASEFEMVYVDESFVDEDGDYLLRLYVRKDLDSGWVE